MRRKKRNRVKKMLAKIKRSLRITHDKLDEEVQGLIDAALQDLLISGVRHFPEGDVLILRAVTLYCKANFGAAENVTHFQFGYDSLKQHLALCGEYNATE